jgi:hypothetical protein
MIARKISVAALGLVALLASNEAQKSVGELFCKNPHALYLAAEYKLIRGDRESAIKLLQIASLRKQQSASAKLADARNTTPERTSACSEGS